jgi:hypothetical protein
MTQFHEGQKVKVLRRNSKWMLGEIIGRHGEKYLVKVDDLHTFDFDEKDIRAIEYHEGEGVLFDSYEEAKAYLFKVRSENPNHEYSLLRRDYGKHEVLQDPQDPTD